MPSHISLGKPTDVITELFDSDDGVKQSFQNHLSAQILSFAESFSRTYLVFEELANDCKECGQQAGLVLLLLHVALDDTLTSVKLMLTGKLSASGNLSRQAVEGLCQAIMCAYHDTLLLGGRELHYWRLFLDEDKVVRGHLASKQLDKNKDRLGLTDGGAENLISAITAHHGNSHAGPLAIANIMDLSPEGQTYFGGHFDLLKLEGYKALLLHDQEVCKWVGQALEQLGPKIKALPKETPNDSPHPSPPPA